MRLAHRIGRWSALAFALVGAIYLLGILYAVATGQMRVSPGQTVMIQPDWLEVVGSAVTLLCAVAFVLMAACIHEVAAVRLRSLTLAASAFANAFAVVTSVSRYLWLAVVRPALLSGESAGLDRLLLHGNGSVALALDFLGWSFFLSLAALCLAPAFGGDRLGHAIRWLLVGYAVFGLATATGYMLSSPPLTSAGNISNILVEVATGLIAIWFGQRPDVGERSG